MAHGIPDWGLVGPRRTTYGLDDVGEAVVRLGSPHLWDRRGDVVYLTAFDNGLEAVFLDDSSPEVVATLCTGNARQGAFAVRIAGDGSAAGVGGVNVYVPLPVSSRVGFEASWSGTFIQNWYYQRLMWWRGREAYWAAVRYVPLTYVLQRYAPPGVWETFAEDVYDSGGSQAANTLKLVVDTESLTYVRTVMNDREIGMTQPIVDLGPGGPANSLEASAGYYRVLDSIGYSVIDSLIVTQNEP